MKTSLFEIIFAIIALILFVIALFSDGRNSIILFIGIMFCIILIVTHKDGKKG